MGRARRPTDSELVPDERFLDWFGALERRHFADLTFPEVRRGVQALSRAYVERRHTGIGAVLKGEGKRAAFAMFYGPLHFLLIQAILGRLGAGQPSVDQIVDLGCGTGAAGAAWALEAPGHPHVRGVERHAWAAAEARWSWRHFGIDGRVEVGEIDRTQINPERAGIIVAFTVNELDRGSRNRLKDSLLAAHRAGARVLIVEPAARRLLPWWDEWAETFEGAGGDAKEWRFRARLPERLRLMDRAAGLDHQFLTGRSLWL